ncbi:MAG: flagellar biosynthesis protein FliQ [Pseudomonadales bacterium]|nr:flagellar biosynthesis protein FliQ [Pseudomonadales bacterium]
MSPESVMDLAYQSMRVALLVSAPLLMAALIIGLLVSLFQAATQINEMTLSFIPKILGIFVMLVLFGPLMIELMVDFTADLLRNIPLIAG